MCWFTISDNSWLTIQVYSWHAAGLYGCINGYSRSSRWEEPTLCCRCPGPAGHSHKLVLHWQKELLQFYMPHSWQHLCSGLSHNHCLQPHHSRQTCKISVGMSAMNSLIWSPLFVVQAVSRYRGGGTSNSMWNRWQQLCYSTSTQTECQSCHCVM
jgi:hypothetical protein